VISACSTTNATLWSTPSADDLPPPLRGSGDRTAPFRDLGLVVALMFV
jgi:hypothetical protein